MKPLVLIGQMGLTDAVEKALDQALLTHELVKVKFIDNKDKTFKQITLSRLARSACAHMVGMIGHIGIFYRPHPQEEKRKIHLP